MCLLEAGVVVLKELIFNSFYFGRVAGHGSTDCKQFLLLVMVMKALIFNSFLLGRVCWS